MVQDVETVEMLQAILKSIDEGIHVVDENGVTIYYNRSVAELDGLEEDEVVGKHVLEVFPSLHDSTSTLLRVIKKGEAIINMPQTYTNVNGKQVDTINTTLPIYVEEKLVGAVEIAKDISKIKELSERLLDLQAQMKDKKSNSIKRDSRNSYFTIDHFITQDKDMVRLKKSVLKTAQTSSPVLVYGETGTGKEIIVQSLHSSSPRKSKPFIAQNCAALPSSLLESLLFGTTKGSFTGSVDREGLFELADRGTLFLDEINSMPFELQAKLLRVLQEGKVRRIGGSKAYPVDVRIVVAMNEDPQKAVDEGRLRSDLYYRINVVSLFLTPLRERKQDIPMLVDYFIHQYSQQFGRQVLSIEDDVLKKMEAYHWPGNVRELEHAIEAAMNMTEGDVLKESHFPDGLQRNWSNSPQYFVDKRIKHNVENDEKAFPSLQEHLQAEEKYWIEKALVQTQGNILQAAKLLHIPRQTFQYKLKKYNINSAEN